MKEFIEKLIGRLKKYQIEYKSGFGELTDETVFRVMENVIYTINQLAEEYNTDIPTLDVNELFEDVEQNDGWIPCSSGEMPKCGEFDIKSVWVTMHRKGVDFYFTRKICWNNYLKRWEWSKGKKMADDWEIIAWQYLEVPAPYQPKGE